MPTKKQRETSESIQKKYDAGRGQGEGATWNPWTHTNEIPSRGGTHNPYSHKLGRECHHLSNLEYRLDRLGEYSLQVTDRREQYPLFPIEKTCELADKYGLSHPLAKATGNYLPLITDTLWTVNVDGRTCYQPLTCKYSAPGVFGARDKTANTLENLNKLNNIEIERLFWKEKGDAVLPLRIVTEKDIPNNVVTNIENFLQQYHPPQELSKSLLEEIAQFLTQRVLQTEEPLWMVAKACDQHFASRRPVSLAVIWHLLATHIWEVDLLILVDTAKPLRLTRINLQGLQDD